MNDEEEPIPEGVSKYKTTDQYDKREFLSVFVMVKIRVQRKKEFEGDFEGFRFFYKRAIQTALQEIGDVKHVDIVT